MNHAESDTDTPTKSITIKKKDDTSHGCIICPPKENCHHEVPLHKTVEPLVRGNAGVEDLFKKINELVEFIHEANMRLTPKHK